MRKTNVRRADHQQVHQASRSDIITRFFQFEVLNTAYRTELLAGITTFMTIAPLLVVNAHMLSNAIFLHQAGDLFDQILTATVLTSAIATLLMGLLTNYPFALGPGTGLIALFAFSIVLRMGMDWRLALSAVLVEGLIFILLTVSKFRTHLTDAIPASIKQATVVGLGLLIAYVGLSSDPTPPTLGAGIIVAGAVTKTTLGSLHQPTTLLAIVGIFLAAILMVRRLKGAVLISILATALLGWIFGIAPLPQGLLSLPQMPTALIGQSLNGFHYLTWQQSWNFLTVVFVLLFVALSDTIGCLTVLVQQVDRPQSDTLSLKSRSSLLSNAVGTTVGGLMGSIPVITYLESASGIFEGGRTGFTAVVVAILFLISLLFTPLFAAIPAFALTSVLVMVGVLMMGCVRLIDWNDLTEAIPAFLMLLIMPLTFSVADGLAVGFIAYPLVKTAQGKVRELKQMNLLLSLIAIAYFIFMTLQT